MNKRHYEHTLPNIRGSLSNTYAWDEKIPALLIRLVNTLLFCRTEEELRQSIDKLRETTELDEFFTYGYGSHHFWCNQRISKGSVQFIQSRLFIATF